MKDTSTQFPTLGEYVDLPTLLSVVNGFFPTKDSLKWFVRQHRDELAANAALINVAGRLRFHPARFQQSAVVIGRAAALPAKEAA